MNKVFETKLGSLSYYHYPIIVFEAKKNKPEDVTKEYVDDFITKFKSIANMTKGPFVVFSDTTNASWLHSEVRDYFSIAVQLIEADYADRFKSNFVYVPNLLMYLLIKLISKFIAKQIPLHTSFNRNKLWKKAESTIHYHFNSKEDNGIRFF